MLCMDDQDWVYSVGERPELGLCCVWTPRIGSMLWANAQDWVSAVGGRPGLDICSGNTASSAWLSTVEGCARTGLGLC
jgi:hypothetical protein